ncbi:MAG: protein kinase [Terrimicrobiaceae bacterium]|nr:protein kinase [Terrimicrobiaceae bacterium]
MPAGEGLVGGRYALERMLGRGGLGEVFLAHDTQLGRWVALKRLRSDAVAGHDALIAEARHLAGLQHPNIVTVYDFLEEDGELMVVMEFIHGGTLEDLEAPLPWTDFVQVARQSLDGLGAAHALGLVHRDIKPGNLMLAALADGSFQVKILDFGLAKVTSIPTQQTVDHSGSLLGSIHTMAPEQLDRRPVDARSDLYSLGCVFFRALTLQNAFDGETVPAIMAAHLQHAAIALGPLRPDVPAGAVEWVQWLYAYDPADRPQSAGEARAALERIVSGQNVAFERPRLIAQPASPSKRSSWVIVLVILVAAIGGALGWWLLGTRESPHAPSVEAVVPTVETMDPADRAGFLERVGQAVTVEGTIGRTGVNKAGTIRFLNFRNSQRGDLSLVFFVSENPEEFREDRLESFVGRRVRVRGTVSEFRGDPQIEIPALTAIEVLP